MMVPTFTSQERHILKQLWSIIGSLDYRRRQAATLERELADCRNDRQRQALMKELFEARRAEEKSVLDLRDGAYVACQAAGAVPWDWAED